MNGCCMGTQMNITINMNTTSQQLCGFHRHQHCLLSNCTGNCLKSSSTVTWLKLSIWICQAQYSVSCLTTLLTVQLGVDNKDAVHTPGATFVLNVDSRITQQGAADTGPAPQPISAAHSPPPPPPYALANKRQPQSLQLSRPVSQASLLDRVSKTWSTPNANAKPVVGCRANLSSSTAPSDVREARAVGGADSRRSSAQGKLLDRLSRGMNKGVCVARSTPWASVLVCYSAEDMCCCETGSG